LATTLSLRHATVFPPAELSTDIPFLAKKLSRWLKNLFKSAADYELMLRFGYKNKIKLSYTPQVLVKMRAGGLSNSSLRNWLLGNREDRVAWQLNGLKPYIFTFYLKPLRKVVQYFQRPEPDSRILIKRFVYIRIFR
jgi:hypothetical protein